MSTNTLPPALKPRHSFSTRQKVRKTSLSHHADKLDYPRYRQEGLPTTSSLMESQVKEFNARVKGSEKFWHLDHAEAMLQLVVWTLRDDGPTLTDGLNSLPTSPFRRTHPTLAA